MSDWTKQAEEMMTSWTKAQQQMWDTWQAAIPQVGGTMSAGSWEKMVDLWKEAIDRTLDTQLTSAKMWASSVKSQPNAPKELGIWTDQMVSTIQIWNESQARLWAGILDSMKQSTPEAFAQRMGEGAQTAFQAWRDSVQKAVEAQEELTKYWSSAQTKPKDSTQ